MKFVSYGFILAAIALTFVALYSWLVNGQIDYAAFYFALSSIAYTVYVHTTKADKQS